MTTPITAAKLAESIRNSDTWDLAALGQLCALAGMADEWDAADCDTFEAVAYRAAETLGVTIA